MVNRVLRAIGSAMIVDGAIGAILPNKYMARLANGPTIWRKTLGPFAQRPTMTRAIGAAELAIGVYLVARSSN